MKIHLASDLHMEFWPDWDNLWGVVNDKFTGGDVAILAGDIFVARVLSKIDNDQSGYKKVADKIHEFVSEIAINYDHVLMVMGNHEHYQGTFQKTADIIREVFKSIDNFHLLDNETFEYQGVTFFGGTAWTDFGTKPELYGFMVERVMNDYRAIKSKTNRGYHRLSYNETFSEHLRFLEALNKVESERLVVISHHAPHQLSINKKFMNAGPDNYGYFSDLTGVMVDKKPELWVHGHMHDDSDYTEPHSGTRVIANPAGYHGHELSIDEYNVKEIEL